MMQLEKYESDLNEMVEIIESLQMVRHVMKE